MQSGISASPTLLTAFSSFASSPILFALPITITHESLHPLEALPFKSHDFSQDLRTLTPHLQPKTPIYLIIRRGSDAEKFTAVTYIPSTAPVRSKTLFASTRSTLVRELGLEKFDGTVFCTDAEEVTDIRQWEERDGTGTDNAGGIRGGGIGEAERRLELLSVEERELEGIKRAEAEERHGTQGRQLGGLGGPEIPGSGRGTPSGGIRMKVGDEVKSSLQDLASGGEGKFVMLGIDIASETVVQLQQSDNVGPEEISKTIPGNQPSYSFYRHPQASADDGVLFLYVCPGTSKVKERMLYASSRNGILEIAKAEGVVVGKRLEAGEPEEVGVQRLSEEVGVKTEDAGASKQGFARPKRPGRR